MKLLLKNSVFFFACCTLTACVGGSASDSAANTAAALVSDDVVKVGKPYTIAGETYTPEDKTDYDVVGYASWYGDELAGEPTANGEVFAPRRISAAHKTLPLPSYVEVTSLDTGRTILARVNDRGPFVNDRIIDLSRGAAEQLGIVQQGVAGVRVRRVYPPLNDRALLRDGRAAPLRTVTGEGLLTVLRKQLASLPEPVAPVRRAPPAQAAGASFQGERADNGAGQDIGLQGPSVSTGNNQVDIQNTAFVIQVGAFSSRDRATSLATKIGAAVYPNEDNSVWRVRYGPYPNASAAEGDLQKVRENGYPNARILAAKR